MKKVKLLFLAACWLLCANQLDAQHFFFSSEKPGTCAAADGIVTIVPTSGTPPFAYLWSNGSTDLSIRNVQKGTYSATLTDANGDTFAASHILNSEELDVNLSDYLPASYCNQNSGKLTVEAIGGLAPFTFLWNNGQTGATISGLALGNYEVTVTDASGCSAIGAYSVGLPHPNYFPYAQIGVIDQPDCGNLSGGALSGSLVYSGYAPYTYLWSNGATTETISGLTEGTYAVTVTDALGCSSLVGHILKKSITMTGSTVCDGTSTGTASASLDGGVAPVNYIWENGQTGPTRSGLANGFYAVTATDANGCSVSGVAQVAVPTVYAYDSSPACFSGNNGSAYAYPQGDNAVSYLWDNGETNSGTNTLSPGLHSVTITTEMGCTVVGQVTIATPIAPPFEILATVTSPADCSNSLGGTIDVTISGGISPYNFYAYGSNGAVVNDPSGLQNIASGDVYISIYNNSGFQCSAGITLTMPDAGGFEPVLTYEDIDCAINGGLGSAAVTGVTTPGVSYAWSIGATTPEVYSLTAGCYNVNVTGSGTCQKFFEFCLFHDKDSIQMSNPCGGIATGKLVNDLGVAGCAGSTGIPNQLIRTLPSGALNLTDDNGVFNILLPDGPFEIETVQYDPADIACPASGQYSLNIPTGATLAGLDFHFLNINPVDHRVQQRPLRTAQPGYPFSVRYKVCNDGNAANAGTLDLSFGNMFGGLAGKWFAKHPASFSLDNETPGAPENNAQFSFPGVAAGQCALLQTDLLTPTTSPVGTQFLTKGTVSPTSGDPTPSNNSTSLYNIVSGSFDPNAVYAFPARNGNPHDGGDILHNVDKALTYQIFFQNTGTAPANTIIVRDTLDVAVNIESLRNITTSHDVKISIEADNTVLVFKFPNINLPDSTADFANSIGSIQYDIDLKPGLAVGTEVKKSAAIYFDFNAPVITNENVLKIVESLAIKNTTSKPSALNIFPNPTSGEFRFFAEKDGELSVFNALGGLVLQKSITAGAQSVDGAELPTGIYLVKLAIDGKLKTGKLVIQR